VESNLALTRQAKEIIMRNIKTMGLAVVAAMALMAFAASSASATALYNGAIKLGTPSTIDFAIPSGGSAKLVDTNGNTLDKCTTSTVKGTLNFNGPTTVTATITELTWNSCTFPTSTVTPGKLKVEQIGATTNGTVKSDATIEVTINTVPFGSCVYGVENNTELGTLTTNSSTAATFDANAVAKKLSGGATCPETAKWTGSYVSEEPVNLRVEAS
jgi:hypothetical protein